ncbi:YezD family protein [Lysinibacillus sp. NPDC097231]|uniref:YezD family protein n=1 Tax=Lysinibacillus sp. NPDC097231 TaxID=3364142 RepID=UPI00380C14D4
MSQTAKIDDKKLEVIANAIQNLQFGEVQITIQDGVIVQINRLEKQRFPQKKRIIAAD